jgi:hypothetical protein
MRSNAYSDQRFTNWTTHDPFWSEANSLPATMRPRAEVVLSNDKRVPIYDRRLNEGFLRPWSVGDVTAVLEATPPEYLEGLDGVYLMGGTSAQQRSRKLIYGQYWQRRIFLYPFPAKMLSQRWKSAPKPSLANEYLRFGARITPHQRGAVLLEFDTSSLRLFFLYNVLLHEIGHHVDRADVSENTERYAHWFADYQRAQLLKAQSA